MKFKEAVRRKDIVIHCNSEEKANILLEHADKIGLLWNSDQSYTPDSNRYRTYGSSTCYCLNSGTFANVNYYNAETSPKYTIVEFDNIEFEDEENKNVSKITNNTVNDNKKFNMIFNEKIEKETQEEPINKTYDSLLDENLSNSTNDDLIKTLRYIKRVEDISNSCIDIDSNIYNEAQKKISKDIKDFFEGDLAFELKFKIYEHKVLEELSKRFLTKRQK